jgi:hypothetical protein
MLQVGLLAPPEGGVDHRPVAGDQLLRAELEESAQRIRPIERKGILERRGFTFLKQVSGEENPGVAYPDGAVVVGVAPTRVKQCHDPLTQVNLDPIVEETTRLDDRTGCDLSGQLGIGLSEPSDYRTLLDGPFPAQVLGTEPLTPDRLGFKRPVAKTVIEVVVSVDGLQG